MKRSIFLAGLLAMASTVMWAGPRKPRVATVREPDGTLRPVWGLAANLVTGDALPTGKVDAAAFSDAAGIVLSAGAVRLVTPEGVEIGAYSTSEQKPVLGIAGPANTAVAWLPSESKLIRWDGSSFVSSTIDAAELPGTPIDIYRGNDRQIEFLLANGRGSLTRASVSVTGAEVASDGSVPHGVDNAIQIGSSLVFQDADGLQIESQTGAIKSLSVRETKLSFERAGALCIHLTAAGNSRQWLLQLDGVEAVLSEIPAVPSSANVPAGDAK